MTANLNYKIFGDTSILIEWEPVIAKDVLRDVLAFISKIEATYISGIQVTTAYNSLLIVFDDFKVNLSKEIENLKQIYLQKSKKIHSNNTLWKIPVCYEDEFGIDLKEIAAEKNRTVNEIIEVHTKTVYTVYFIGFLPGFLYLGGLPEEITMPRKATPRLKVEKGSVAIGGNQTGVYPVESPGGWNIIGNSPLTFFDVTKDVPCFAKAGDAIQFYSVPKKKYNDIKTLVNAGVFQIESEDYNG
ncbi:5-oxoprolinase subunit PxpB [Cellulophaga sp. 20_2_10]|uniref:5-oxoprolinase subunit PxpB n=1 Tax=Cellulophaga sp. 20_2_10 TaxID=2942476 RepID=UPI00201A370D|nr:5-oxoprolinase subunit PxpB [Cellulophaga sp. 20_2_10]MCL5244427.1 5-oxoprolinase subunit PxpB [Cellulophaga sp. 20_2_10]